MKNHLIECTHKMNERNGTFHDYEVNAMKKFRGIIGILITITGFFMIFFSMRNYEGSDGSMMFIGEATAYLALISYIVFCFYGIISIVKRQTK